MTGARSGRMPCSGDAIAVCAECDRRCPRRVHIPTIRAVVGGRTYSNQSPARPAYQSKIEDVFIGEVTIMWTLDGNYGFQGDVGMTLSTSHTCPVATL